MKKTKANKLPTCIKMKLSRYMRQSVMKQGKESIQNQLAHKLKYSTTTWLTYYIINLPQYGIFEVLNNYRILRHSAIILQPQEKQQNIHIRQSHSTTAELNYMTNEA